MRTNYLNFLHVFILAARCLTLDTDGENSDCEVEIKVRRNTAYKAFPGENLRINCTVTFCNSSPPTVTWYTFQINDTAVPVTVSSGGHITSEWKHLGDNEGMLFLNFHKILRDDSGDDGPANGTQINDTGKVELTTLTWTTSELGSPETPDTFWPFVYRVVGIMGFVIIVLSLCVATRCRCKEESSDTPDPSRQPSTDASSPAPIYENESAVESVC